MDEILCNKNTNQCIIFDDLKIKIYHDCGHLTLEGSKYIGKIIFNKKIIK